MTDKKAVHTHGKRKTAIARIRIREGTGRITVNGTNLDDFFRRKSIVADIKRPIALANITDQIDVIAHVNGGGLSGQAGALRQAIARALKLKYPGTKTTMKSNGLLTRDDRKVERKMYGHKKSRKSFQFSKR